MKLSELDRSQFPHITKLARGTNGSPLSVTLKAVRTLEDSSEIADFGHEMVTALSKEVSLEEATNSVTSLISFAMAEFANPRLVKRWEEALPQTDLMGGHLPNRDGIVHYSDTDNLGQQLDRILKRRRKR